MKNRKCTDLLFVLLFFISLGGYGYTVKYSLENGNPDKLLRPVNGDGKLCGVGDLKLFPKLYYIMNSAEKPMTPRAVCVDVCPAEITSTFECHGTAKIDVSICRNEYSVHGKGHIGYGTHPLLNRYCIPDVDKLPPQIDLSAYDNLVGEFGLDDVQEMVEDVIESYHAFFFTFFSAVMVTVIYAVLIYYMTGLIVWISVIATGMAIFALAYFVNEYHNDQYGTNVKYNWSEVTEQNYGKWTKVAVYVLLGIGVLYFILVTCLWKNIYTSVIVLKTASVILIQNTRIYMLPFFCAVVLLMWMVTWIFNVA